MLFTSQHEQEVEILPYIVDGVYTGTFRLKIRDVGIKAEVEMFPDEVIKFAKECIERTKEHEKD